LKTIKLASQLYVYLLYLW